MEYGLVMFVPIIAIAGGITYAIFNQHFKTKRKIAESEGSPALREALERSNETNAAVLAKLTTLDSRISVIEKTLNEV